MINLENIKIENFNTTVYFSSEKLLILQKEPFVEILDKKSKKTINKIRIKNLSHFKICEHLKNVILIFGSREVLVVNSNDGSFELFDITNGDIVTDLHSKDKNIVFGATVGGMFHYAVYDVENQSRLYQTQSTRASTLSYFFGKNVIASIMSNSQIICHRYNATEIFKRFEYQYVVPGITEYGRENIIYCNNNSLKIVNLNDFTIETREVPIIKINKLETIIHNYLYCICENKKSICRLDLSNNQIQYEMRANSDIYKTLVSKGKLKSNITHILLFSTNNSFGIADLNRGEIIYRNSIPKIKEIKEYSDTSDIIIRTHMGGSHVISKEIEETGNRIVEL